MTSAQKERGPLWNRWWLWCGGCLLLVGFVISEQKQLRELRHETDGGRSARTDEGDEDAPDRGNADLAKPPALLPTSADGHALITTGDSQIDALLGDEMRRWQEDFGFDARVHDEALRRALHAFRPFLLFAGGREAVPETCRLARDEADRTRRRMVRTAGVFGRVGREDTILRGTYVFNAIETAAADWLQEKTVDNVDPQVPQGGLSVLPPSGLRVVRGSIVNGMGRLVWAGRPDLPQGVNARLATALLEWVDEFQLSEDDVPALARAVLSRLLVLPVGPGGEPAPELVRLQAGEAGIKWLRESRDEVRSLFVRSGWVNVPRLVRVSTEVAARHFGGDGAVIYASGERPAMRLNGGSGAIQAGLSVESWERGTALIAPFDQATAKNAQRICAECFGSSVEQTNSLGMKMILIPAGEFWMGSSPAQIETARHHDRAFKKEWEQEEQPQHRVRINRPFYLGAHEVTRREFAQFVRATGHQTDAIRDGKGGMGYDPTSGEFRQDPNYDWQNPGFAQQENQPVVNVSWNDANAFCEWLSQKEQVIYRLPTEAEWEYACRAGTRSQFYCGDDPEGLAAVANVADATAKTKFAKWNTISAEDGFIFTAPVGSFRPNNFGLFDMHGNVWEWCQDWYRADYYAKSPESDPQGPAKGTVRVFRGGSWYDAAGFCRSAFRYWDAPTYRDYFLGFRVVAVPTVK